MGSRVLARATLATLACVPDGDFVVVYRPADRRAEISSARLVSAYGSVVRRVTADAVIETIDRLATAIASRHYNATCSTISAQRQQDSTVWRVSTRSGGQVGKRARIDRLTDGQPGAIGHVVDRYARARPLCFGGLGYGVASRMISGVWFPNPFPIAGVLPARGANPPLRWDRGPRRRQGSAATQVRRARCQRGSLAAVSEWTDGLGGSSRHLSR
jgi:hypothetical protein